MSFSQGTAMDVDSPAGTLKRCSSAPMINENAAGMTASPPAASSSRETGSFNLFGPSNPPRTRRSSYSFSPHTGGSPGGGMRLAPRINQLRQEECADVSNSREVAHECETTRTMQISQSWEDLTLLHKSPEPTKMTPIHVNLHNPYTNYCNSPSPTRLGSPGFQSPTRNQRTFIRRSASPVLRPSPLGAKRKLEEDHCNAMSPRVKRFVSCGGAISERGGLLTTTTSSPQPGSLSSIGTPESISSADSPGFQFRMMDSPSPSRPSAEPMAISKQDQEMSEGPS